MVRSFLLIPFIVVQVVRQVLGKKPPCSMQGQSASFCFGSTRVQQLITLDTIQFYRAKLVLGDLNKPGLEDVVSEIRRAGGCVLLHLSQLGWPLTFQKLSGKPSDYNVM